MDFCGPFGGAPKVGAKDNDGRGAEKGRDLDLAKEEAARDCLQVEGVAAPFHAYVTECSLLLVWGKLLALFLAHFSCSCSSFSVSSSPIAVHLSVAVPVAVCSRLLPQRSHTCGPQTTLNWEGKQRKFESKLLTDNKLKRRTKNNEITIESLKQREP